MIGNYQVGAFRGRKLIQRSGSVGGARSVFVKLQGNKNELTYPTLGGQIKNPFKGAAKMFAGDLVEYRTDKNGVKPEIYILKTYKLHKTASTVADVEFERTPYSHAIFVGDKIGTAPAKLGGACTPLTVQSVEKAMDGVTPIYKVHLSATLNAQKGDVLVESDGANMMVKNINAVVDADMDMLDAPAESEEDFDGARYYYTPALGGVMYTEKMSPMPKCVLDKNQSSVNGWFKIQF